MMLQKILKSLFTVTAIVLLAGCSTAVFPEVIEDDSISVSESGRKVIKEGEGLGSDEKNAAYEEMPDEDDVFADVVPVTEKRKDAAGSGKPVEKTAAADRFFYLSYLFFIGINPYFYCPVYLSHPDFLYTDGLFQQVLYFKDFFCSL